jgi:hypothetical protein
MGACHDCRVLVVPPCAALEIRRGKGFERLHEALQGCLHHTSADLSYPGLAMGNAGLDPGHDGCFDDLVVSSCLLRQYTSDCIIRRSIVGQPSVVQCWQGELYTVGRH